MEKKLMEEIINFYYSFDKTKDYYEKCYIIFFFNYIRDLMPDNNIINYMIENINSKAKAISYQIQECDNEINEMINIFLEDNSYFFDNNAIPPERVFDVSDKSLIKLSDENIIYILESFLKSLGSEIYDFYQEMKNNGRIVEYYDTSTAFTSLNKSNTIIFFKKNSNLKDALELAHEIAHAYYVSLNGIKVKDRHNIATDIKDEIAPLIVEIRFIRFLFDNMVIEPSMIFQKLYYERMDNYYQRRNEYKYLKYFIASYIADLLDDVDINEYFRHIYKTSVQNLILEVNSKKKEGKVLEK